MSMAGVAAVIVLITGIADAMNLAEKCREEQGGIRDWGSGRTGEKKAEER
jgi:alpha-1,2-mannosyltransferase